MKSRGIVAAGHEKTAQAVESVLSSGGNAFDGILAGMCAACVAEPVLTSLGGGGFLLAEPADGKPRIYDFFVQTPRRRRPENELQFYPVMADFGEVTQRFDIGIGAAATPGFVAGLFDIHADLGSMPMTEIVTPAVELGSSGLTVNGFQAYIFSICAPIFLATPAATEIWGSKKEPGTTVAENERNANPELAEVLDVLAREGRDLFYRGEIGQSIVAQCREIGGCLTSEDLEGYAVELRHPLRVDYRGTQISTNPPPASGGILIAFALELLKAVPDLGRFPFGSPQYLRLLAEAMVQTNRARVESLAGDSDPRMLLDEGLLERYRKEIVGRAASFRGTTQISVMDREGNVATLTMSNGAGSGYVVPQTGIMLNNMLGEEDLAPAGFHCWPPNQRMTSMMAPSTLRFRDGRVVATGSGGSKRIRTAILQVLLNIVDHRMAVEEAVASPRLFVDKGVLSVEGGFREDAVQRLVEAFPDAEVWDRLNLYFGGAHTVENNRGTLSGCGDPRRGGVCIEVH